LQELDDERFRSLVHRPKQRVEYGCEACGVSLLFKVSVKLKRILCRFPGARSKLHQDCRTVEILGIMIRLGTKEWKFRLTARFTEKILESRRAGANEFGKLVGS